MSTPTYLKVDIDSNLIDTLHTFISTVPGWSVDKYTSGDELYINNTSEDGTIGYYSVKYIDKDIGVSAYLQCYANLGFDDGLAVDEQPGVMSNSNGAAAWKLEFVYAVGRLGVAHLMADENYLLMSTSKSGNIKESRHVYMGILAKHFAYTGGNIILGSTRVNNAPTMVYYHDGNDGYWYTVDGGIFADSGGVASDINVIDYTSTYYVVDGIKNTMKFKPYELFIEYDGGFAPIGFIRNFWEATNTATSFYFPPYSKMVFNGVTYMAMPQTFMYSDVFITII